MQRTLCLVIVSLSVCGTVRVDAPTCAKRTRVLAFVNDFGLCTLLLNRKGGPPGNLVVYLRVRDDSELRRDGVTIMSSVTVPYTDAILGTTVRVKTVDGMVELKIPPGTQPGTTLVMGKKGVPKLGAPNQRGDHNVTVNVSIPKRLSKEEKALVENLSELAAGVSA